MRCGINYGTESHQLFLQTGDKTWLRLTSFNSFWIDLQWKNNDIMTIYKQYKTILIKIIHYINKDIGV